MKNHSDEDAKQIQSLLGFGEFSARKSYYPELQKRIEELEDLQSLLSGIINSMPSALIALDAQGRITQWNVEAERLSGLSFSQALGMPAVEALPLFKEHRDWVQKAVQESAVSKKERIKSGDQERLKYYDVTIYPLVQDQVKGSVIRVDDVSEKVRIEEIIIQSEKMQSIGGLAAGMAHEINNPLAGILHNAQIIAFRLSKELRKNHEIAAQCGVTMDLINDYANRRSIMDKIRDIQTSGERAADIVSNMLSFSRKTEVEFESQDLHVLLDHTIELASKDYDLKKKYDFRQIRMTRDYAPNLPYLYCVGGQIQQVVLNLLINIAQAMNENKEQERSPQITLRTALEPDMIRIEVEDNGPGMTPFVKKRIFEPFFTTKRPGKGTGLGLAVSYFIVTKTHHGTMHVESTPGQGATFIIRLPLAQSE
ncbi:two-component system sensor histidine kinase NtrB [Desulfatibacillum aliphaticivorans]|uniref:two-component system sensor histidine kinase NtrB n=1 Tax=Desulfatibacillum aliphaticivorans TaxID=218208 RepID=UPI00041C5911|nr:ATP-binding protein [Desulfatibacillum aliphaticivorans]